MRTTSAVAILKNRAENRPELKKLVSEERVNLQAALAIREAREKCHLSQKDLAHLIGTTQSVVSRLEDADYEGHTLKYLDRIAEALNRRVVIQFKKESSARSRRHSRVHSRFIPA